MPRTLVRAQWGVVLATVAFVPLAFSTWTFDVFNLTALTILWIGVAGATGLEFSVGGFARRSMPSIWPVVSLYLAALGLTTLTSRAPAVSALGSYGRYGGLATVVPIVALAWLVARAVAGSPERQHQLMLAIVASAVGGATYLWAQELGVDAFDWLEPWRQQPRHPPGALGNSNFSGAHLAIATGPAVIVAVKSAGWHRAVAAAATALILTGVGVSQSRGAMLAAAAALIVIAATSSAKRRHVVVTALGAALAIGAIAVLVNDGGLDELGGTRTWNERVDLWEVALRGAADRPILGGGPDLFMLTFDEHGSTSLDGVLADEPHNVLLDHLDGSGLIGAAAWLAVVASVVVVAHRSRDRALRPWLAMGVAYLTQAMFSIDVVPLLLWGWVAVAGIVGVADDRAVWGHLNSRRLRSRTAVALGAAAVVAVVAVGPFRADMAHRRGIEASNDGHQDRAIAQLSQAVDRHEWEPRFHRRLGIQLTLVSQQRNDPHLLADAVRELERAIELLPDDQLANQWLQVAKSE